MPKFKQLGFTIPASLALGFWYAFVSLVSLQVFETPVALVSLLNRFNGKFPSSVYLSWYPFIFNISGIPQHPWPSRCDTPCAPGIPEFVGHPIANNDASIPGIPTTPVSQFLSCFLHPCLLTRCGQGDCWLPKEVGRLPRCRKIGARLGHSSGY